MTMATSAQLATPVKMDFACLERMSVTATQILIALRKTALNPPARGIHVNSVSMTPVPEITAIISGHVPTGASVQTESRLASVIAFVPTLQNA